jgi:aspartyl-tRNA(Asn)/glutamyl-tRNA(Gln) amidotransferase subunit B
MNSFSASCALDVEFARQCSVLPKGGRIEQQTMLWDANTGEVRPRSGSLIIATSPARLLPLAIPRERIDWIVRASRIAKARRERYRREHRELTDYDIDVLTASAAMGEYFEQVARQADDPKTAANWTMGEVLAALKSTGQSIEHFTVRPADLAALLVMVRDGVVSHSAAKQVFGAMVTTGDRPSLRSRSALR